MRTIALAFLTLLALAAAPLRAEDAKPFATAASIDLRTVLKPPPTQDSAQTKAEIGEVLTIQVTRSPEMEAQAQADAVEDIWRFANVMGPAFKADSLPVFSAFFDRVVATEGAVVDPAKDSWKRPRPHQASPLVKPVVKISNSGAYPSGHTTVGTLMGIVLSNMVPEKRTEIMDRAWAYGWNRVIGGIHYRSDIEAGRIAGSVIAARIMEQPEFQTEFAAAKAELRKVLGL
ncbi:acid phosphatase [Bosea sp. TAF32]|uniref:acid phosphatase n=1 Tax=Bosea sp. TAF32 TaxID=3237482 RepID=UPI003F93F119